MNLYQRCNAANSDNAKYCQNCGYALPKKEIVENKEAGVIVAKPKKNKKLIGVVVGIVAGLALLFGIRQLAMKGIGELMSYIKAGGSDKALMQVASELNKSCPFMVDAVTRLDNVFAYNHALQYNYTLINIDKSEVDTLNVKNVLKPGIVNIIKSSPQMKGLRDHRVSFHYFYKDKNGIYLFQILVSPDLYEGTDES